MKKLKRVIKVCFQAKYVCGTQKKGKAAQRAAILVNALVFQKYCRKSFERPIEPLTAGGLSVIFSIPAIELLWRFVLHGDSEKVFLEMMLPASMQHFHCSLSTA